MFEFYKIFLVCVRASESCGWPCSQCYTFPKTSSFLFFHLPPITVIIKTISFCIPVMCQVKNTNDFSCGISFRSHIDPRKEQTILCKDTDLSQTSQISTLLFTSYITLISYLNSRLSFSNCIMEMINVLTYKAVMRIKLST